ncbi:hypothetical protein [Sorangium sp. So ce426]|uniref:hypothetical protein n=1 Tax=unclassified Sorangium TaxID=2621164 RepID=UPI003F5C0636
MMTMRMRGTEVIEVRYALEHLFSDQEHDWVSDTIAPVLAWVPGRSRSKRSQPFRFVVDHVVPGRSRTVHVDLTWDLPLLERLVPGVEAHARRLRDGRTAQREHVTELAAYGLTFVAISTLMPGRRVKTMRKGSAPDILFDVTPGSLRGVEAAGRATGGRSALLAVRGGAASRREARAKDGKASELRARRDIAEVHLSLWCASPRVSMMEQVKP